MFGVDTIRSTFSLHTVDLHCEPKDVANVLIWQNSIHPDHFEEMCKIHMEQLKGFDDSPYKLRVRHVLAKAKFLHDATKKTIDLIIMPEFSVLRKHLGIIKKWSRNNKDTLIVAGSAYKKDPDDPEKKRSTATVMLGGKCYETYKSTLSPKEEALDLNLESGNGIYEFTNTPVGTLCLMICADFLNNDNIEYLRRHSEDVKYDVICVIACQPNPEDATLSKKHYQYANSVCNFSSNPYVIFSNIKCNPIATGKSAVFSNLLHPHARKQLCLNQSILANHPNVATVMPDDSRYMFLSLKIKNRIPKFADARDVRDTPQIKIFYIEGLCKYSKYDKHKIRLVAFDLDGTLVQGPHHYSWASIYKTLGLPDESRKKHKDAYLQKMNPTYEDYNAWCRANLNDFKSKKLTRKQLHDIAEEHFELSAHVDETFAELRRRKIRIALISGGVDIFATHFFGEDLKDKFDDYFINEFQYDGADHLINIVATKYDFQGKAEAISLLCSKYDIPRRLVSFVGDARNDQPALLYVGLGIAFYPTAYTVSARYFIPSEAKNNAKVVEKIPGRDKNLYEVIKCIDEYSKNPRYY